MRRCCDSDKCALSTGKLQSILPSIFLSFIVAAPRGNNIFAFLSSPRGAGTIFFRFIVSAPRGNNIFAILSSPCSAGTIFVPFYRHRAARERYFAVLSSPCSAGTIFFRFIVAAQRSCKYICYASEKRADCPAKRQTNAA